MGPLGFAVFQLLVGGTVLAALVHAIFLAALIFELVDGNPAVSGVTPSMGLHVSILVGGYLVSAILGIVGLLRRRLHSCAWTLMLIPVYWLLLSFAAWRALYHLIRDPYRWEKTTHGLARTSRLTPRPRSEIRDIFEDRRRLRPASASR
jgi:hypothetical protein